MIESINLYEKLKGKLGEQETKDLLAYISQTVTADVATRADIAALDGKINLVRTELSGQITNLRTELGSRIDQLAEKLEKDVATKVDLANLEGKFRLYFVVLSGLIVLTNPKVLDLFGKLLGIVK